MGVIVAARSRASGPVHAISAGAGSGAGRRGHSAGRGTDRTDRDSTGAHAVRALRMETRSHCSWLSTGSIDRPISFIIGTAMLALAWASLAQAFDLVERGPRRLEAPQVQGLLVVLARGAAEARAEREQALLAAERLVVRREAAIAWLGLHFAERKLAVFASERTRIEIDASKMRRLEFVSAGGLFNQLAQFQAQGKLTIIRHPNALVAALMRVMGIDQIAQIEMKP